MSQSPIIVALDFPHAEQAVSFAKTLNPQQVRLKVGKELFVAAGPVVIEHLQALGFEVFLDLKFHDIPNTVAHACVEAAKLGVWMVNVHASGGEKMMVRVMNELAKLSSRPLVIGVTVLTSMDESVWRALGMTMPIEEQVLNLARLVSDSGLDGVVCSGMEAETLRKVQGRDFTLVTPGIRLPQTTLAGDDQYRIMTPKAAIAAGADYLVMGRAVTRADNPQQTVEAVIQSLV